jgi:hypothetical protein
VFLLLLLWCKTTMKTTMVMKNKKRKEESKGVGGPCDRNRAFPWRFFLFPWCQNFFKLQVPKFNWGLTPHIMLNLKSFKNHKNICASFFIYREVPLDYNFY